MDGARGSPFERACHPPLHSRSMQVWRARRKQITTTAPTTARAGNAMALHEKILLMKNESNHRAKKTNFSVSVGCNFNPRPQRSYCNDFRHLVLGNGIAPTPSAPMPHRNDSALNVDPWYSICNTPDDKYNMCDTPRNKNALSNSAR